MYTNNVTTTGTLTSLPTSTTISSNTCNTSFYPFVIDYAEIEARVKGKKDEKDEKNKRTCLEIEDVFINFDNYTTTVKWKDNTVTSVTLQPDEYSEFDIEKAIGLCFMKHVFHNTGAYMDEIRKFGYEVVETISDAKTGEYITTHYYRNAKAAAKKYDLPVKTIVNRCVKGNEILDKEHNRVATWSFII